MAKVTAPLLSFDAAGSIGDTITFGKWKGRNYARRKVAPTNPNTAGQQTQRTAFGNAVASWKAQDQATQDSWTDRAKALGLVMSGFNLYVREYISQGVVDPATPTLP